MVVAAGPPVRQEIRFCRAADGTRIAYATHGAGPPLVIVACWLSNLQHDWVSPVWRHFLDDLGRLATVVRYDERGFGLSDWDVRDFSFEARVADLEALVDMLGLGRFALLGMSGTSPAALAYAARHPDRVSRLVLYGGFAGLVDPFTPEEEAEEAAYVAMIRAGWARPDPIFRRVFTTQFIPGANDEQMAWFDDLQRTSTSTENMLAARVERLRATVIDELPRIQAPALILHARDDRNVGFEHARVLATHIPNARLVPLDSENHILLADEPAWQVFVREVAAFLEADRGARASSTHGVVALSAREREVLTLAADGLANDQIADRLGLSRRTVERHLSNAYVKLGLEGAAARAGAVAALLRSPS